jgi:hopanoid biosynthesis associated radical SAM protein HpnH
VAVPVIQQIRVGTYIMKQRIKGVEKYPLVLMLEPLFRCNLACPGCGKIDYEDSILNKRLSAQQCLHAVDECGAPIISIPGGEPLIHKEIQEIVEGIVARKKFVYLCTNALLMEKNLDKFTPSPYLTFSVHLDGPEAHHDIAVAQPGTFKRAVSAIRAARKRLNSLHLRMTIWVSKELQSRLAMLMSVPKTKIISCRVKKLRICSVIFSALVKNKIRNGALANLLCSWTS